MTTRDLIIGCFTNYDWSKIKYWTNSIDRSGFVGDKVMIVYNSDYATVSKLINQNFMICGFGKDETNQRLVYSRQFSIVVQRFFNMWEYLNKVESLNSKYRYVITTDVKDVIFQRNPSEWLEQNIGDKKICISSESLSYQNEPWGNDNLMNSFPALYDTLKEKTIWNCGVLAGHSEYMRDLFLSIFSFSQGNKLHNPDQAALNVILNTKPYADICKFTNPESAWAAQLGTTMDPSKIQNFRSKLQDPEPKFDGINVVNHNNIPFYIVHQYDRIPAIRSIIENRFDDAN